MRAVRLRKYLPAAASIAGPCCSFGNWKPLISLGFSPWHGACCSTDEPLTARPSWSFAMLPALGAASAALDAIASLTTPNPASSSQPTGSGPFSPGPTGSSSAPPADSALATGFAGGAQISPDNISALLQAQSQFKDFNASDAISSLSAPKTSSSDASSLYNDASSAYSNIGQLAQQQAIPVPFSISV